MVNKIINFVAHNLNRIMKTAIMALTAGLKFKKQKEANSMKKTILIITVVASITLFGSQAFACMWDGYWGGPMGMPVNGYYSNIYSGGAYQGFFDATAQIRQELAIKRAEYSALMSNSGSDPNRAAALNSEITALSQQLSTQAQSYNLPIPAASYGYGPMSRGMMGGGYGYGGMGMGCW
jgi:hypothetical protein